MRLDLHGIFNRDSCRIYLSKIYLPAKAEDLVHHLVNECQTGHTDINLYKD